MSAYAERFSLRRMIAGIVAGISLLLAAHPAFGDTILKTNGQRLTGLVTEQTATEITLQTNVGALVVRTQIPLKDIASIQRDAVAENRYCRIPIHGIIGESVKAEWVAKALEQAEGFGANYVVLDIDSPGGHVDDMAKIIDLLEKQTKFTMVAHIKKAMSASAIIALTCRKIVMQPQASIGAAVPWKFGPDGTPNDVEAKFLSAYRAVAKGAAEYGHHDPLLAEGMMDMDLVLSAIHQDNMVAVVEGQPEEGRVLKKAKQIMCLSTLEAEGCGLAAGSCANPRDLQKILKVADWSPVGDSVWAYMLSQPELEKVNEDRSAAEQNATLDRDKADETLKEVDARIALLTQQKEDAAKRAASLAQEYQGELNKIDPHLSAADHDTKTLALRTQYESAYAEAQNALGKADSELQDLQKLRTALAAKLRDN